MREQLKEKYLAFLDQYGLTPQQALISAGGACLMYRLRERFDDIDVDVPSSVFARFVQRGFEPYWVDGAEGRTRLIELPGHVDIHDIKEMKQGIIIEGVGVYTLKDLLIQKQQLNRPKDQADILAIQTLLGG